jgi:rare lipoprotein A
MRMRHQRLLLAFLLAVTPWAEGYAARKRPATLPKQGACSGKTVGLVMKGKASWYGSRHNHGRKTASGEVFDMHGLSAAHPWWPMKTWVRVTNRSNGRSVVLRINDRMPRHPGRVVDVSRKAAEKLGFLRKGLTLVHVEVVPPPGSTG